MYYNDIKTYYKLEISKIKERIKRCEYTNRAIISYDGKWWQVAHQMAREKGMASPFLKKKKEQIDKKPLFLYYYFFFF